MPGSVRENDADLRAFVASRDIVTVLDVGPGRGTYAYVLDGLGLIMDAVEVWGPYVPKYRLDRLYRKVTVGDVRDHGDFDYDLVLFGDVLEHMHSVESRAVWQRASRQARYGLISVPIVHYPQGPSHGNPHEEHVQDHLTPEEVRADYGPFVEDWCYEVTGTFIADWTRP